jgi:hypothetical protein
VGRTERSLEAVYRARATVELSLPSFDEPQSEPLLELMAWCVLHSPTHAANSFALIRACARAIASFSAPFCSRCALVL